MFCNAVKATACFSRKSFWAAQGFGPAVTGELEISALAAEGRVKPLPLWLKPHQYWQVNRRPEGLRHPKAKRYNKFPRNSLT